MEWWKRKETTVTVGLEPQGLKLGRKIYARERPMFSSLPDLEGDA
jgi:hypothetical protein